MSLFRSLSLENDQSDLEAMGILEQPVEQEEVAVDVLDDDSVETADLVVQQNIAQLDALEEVKENMEEMAEQLEEQQEVIEKVIEEQGGIDDAEVAEQTMASVERFYVQFEKQFNKFNKIVTSFGTGFEAFKHYTVKKDSLTFSKESFLDTSTRKISSEAILDSIKSATNKAWEFLLTIWKAFKQYISNLYASFFNYKTKNKKQMEAVLERLKGVTQFQTKELKGGYLKVISSRGKVLQGADAVSGFKQAYQELQKHAVQIAGSVKKLELTDPNAAKEIQVTNINAEYPLYLADMVILCKGESMTDFSVKLMKSKSATEIKDVKAMSLDVSDIKTLASETIKHLDSGAVKTMEDEIKTLSSKLDTYIGKVKEVKEKEALSTATKVAKFSMGFFKQSIAAVVSYDKTVCNAAVKLAKDSISGSVKSAEGKEVKKLA